MPGSPLTPNELFYVRNHLPVPLVKGAASPDASPGDLDLSETVNDDWKIQVQGLDPEKPPLELTVRDLKTRFEKVVVPATLQCSGNRRNELSREVKPVKGLEWDSGAISTAAWGGARLSDVLKAAGVASQEEALSRGRKHVCFDGGDIDGGSLNSKEASPSASASAPPPPPGYGASIPSRRALDRNADVILAYEMNGRPLPRDHGAPVRAVVPGVTAARSVKWLTRIALSESEHESHFQRKDYRTFAPGTDWDTVDWDASPSIVETNVTSAILEPADGATLADGPYLRAEGSDSLTVKGWAFSVGGAASSASTSRSTGAAAGRRRGLWSACPATATALRTAPRGAGLCGLPRKSRCPRTSRVRENWRSWLGRWTRPATCSRRGPGRSGT